MGIFNFNYHKHKHNNIEWVNCYNHECGKPIRKDKAYEERLHYYCEECFKSGKAKKIEDEIQKAWEDLYK